MRYFLGLISATHYKRSNGQNDSRKISSAALPGLTALAGPAAHAMEYPRIAQDIERPVPTTTNHSDGSFVAAGNSSLNSSSNSFRVYALPADPGVCEETGAHDGHAFS